MTTTRLLRFLIPLLTFAAACDSSTSPTPLAVATAKAKAIWNAEGLQSYSFTAVRSCECVADGVGPVRITVVDGAVSSVVMISTGAAVDPGLWFDVNALFALIDNELATRPALLEATFNAATGYPTHVKYGDLAVDAGADVTITEFAPTP